MNTDFLKTRQTKYGLYVTVYIAVILGVLGAGNWLAQRHNWSADATSNKKFSLADQTTKVVRELKSDVKILYFDKADGFARAKDLLDRYDALSTKLSVDYIDPDKKPMIAKQYGYRTPGAIFIEANNKREEARSLTEEEVTSALIRTLKTGERMVCAVAGGGEHSFDEPGRDGYSNFKATLEKNNYKTKTIRLIEKPEVPADCTILIVGGPRFDYLDPMVEAIKKYFGTGGRVFLLIDPPADFGKDAIAENAKLTALLESWGVMLQKNIVLDTSGVGQIFGLSEAVPLALEYKSHITVRDMKGVATAFPLTRSVEVKSAPNFTTEELLSTTANSFATSKLTLPMQLDPAKDKKGPFPLAAAGSVTLSSPGAKMGRFAVFGSSAFIANNYLGFQGNRDLALNIINWLSSDEDLISIRPKDPQDRRITLNRRQMDLVYYSTVLLPPLVVIFAGLRVWWRRR